MREQRRRRRGYLTTTDENGENGNNNGNNGGNGDKNNRGDNKGQGNDNKNGKSDEPPPLIVTVDLPRQGKTDGVREGGVSYICCFIIMTLFFWFCFSSFWNAFKSLTKLVNNFYITLHNFTLYNIFYIWFVSLFF